MNFSEFLNESTTPVNDQILKSITIGELLQEYKNSDELIALIDLLIKDNYKEMGENSKHKSKQLKVGSVDFSYNPQQLKGKSEVKKYFIDQLLNGPKIFTHLFEPGTSFQNPSKFRHDLVNAGIIKKGVDNKYDFTEEYKKQYKIE